MRNNQTELTVAQVGGIARCHRNTVINYERKGLIRCMRDRNNFRWFPLSEAMKLREMLAARTTSDERRVG